MGSKPVLSGVEVTWDDIKYNQNKKNIPDVADGGRYKGYKKGDLKSGNDDFTPERVVVDLKLNLGNPNVSEVDLDDVHLKIAYSGTAPTLGYWNGAKWVKFNKVNYGKNIADVTLPSPWPTDPAIGGNP